MLEGEESCIVHPLLEGEGSDQVIKLGGEEERAKNLLRRDARLRPVIKLDGGGEVEQEPVEEGRQAAASDQA